MIIKETDGRFYLNDSLIEDAGMGLFANVDINEGEILEVVGFKVKKDSVEDICTRYANDYKFSSPDPEFYIVPIGFGGMVNHTSDPHMQNVEIRHINNSTVYYFIKNVKKNQEILGYYGEKWNEKLNEEAAWQMFLDLELYNLEELKR
jgi:hypothetical protein